MRVVAGEARQVNLTSTITASGSQTTLAAVQTTMAVPTGGTSFTYAGELTAPTGSAAALDDDTIRNPTFTPDVPGLYTVTITATDAASGASLTLVRTQEVASELSIALTADSSQNTLDAVPTTVTPTGGLGLIAYSAAVLLPDRTAGAVSGGTTTTPSFTPTIAGLYVLTVTATDAAGQTATATRKVLVGTAALSVSIAAISNQTAATGTINCDSTASGAVGSVTYAWTGTKPDGTAASFADAAATDTTITLSASDRWGTYTVAVTATDAAGRTARATTTFRVGDANGWITDYNRDFTADANSTIAASPWSDAAGGSWTVENIANATTFDVLNGTGLRIIVGATGTLSAGVRTVPALSRLITDVAPNWGAQKRLLTMVQLGTGTAIAAASRMVGLLHENPSNRIGDSGTTERGGGVLYRNIAGSTDAVGAMMGHSSGNALVIAAYPAGTAVTPRVIALDRYHQTLRVGYSTNTAAYGDPAHASWAWGGWYGIDYEGTPPELDPSTDFMSFFGSANATLIVEKLALLVKQ